MTKCKDGRKHVIVNEYEKKDSTEVARHERSCPTPQTDTELFVCCVCGEEHGLGETHDFEVKGQQKQICKGCADTVHGLV